MRSGHKTAFLCTETTMYRYIEDLGTPKKWFIANADEIMRIYSEAHQISKEDLFLGQLIDPSTDAFYSDPASFRV
jgi:abelson tyrosine-protein kinase 1